MPTCRGYRRSAKLGLPGAQRSNLLFCGPAPEHPFLVKSILGGSIHPEFLQIPKRLLAETHQGIVTGVKFLEFEEVVSTSACVETRSLGDRDLIRWGGGGRQGKAQWSPIGLCGFAEDPEYIREYFELPETRNTLTSVQLQSLSALSCQSKPAQEGYCPAQLLAIPTTLGRPAPACL